MIEIPNGPYNCDFITDFCDNIYDFIHKKYYKSNPNMYQYYNNKLDDCLKIKDFSRRKASFYSLRKELLGLS